jgi:antiviral helicase SKI2
MSGRAGRRGLDEKGTVIIYVKDPNKLPSFMEMSKIVDHKGMELSSKFKMTYRIILNLLTSKDLDAVEMMKKSFHENYRFTSLPKNI